MLGRCHLQSPDHLAELLFQCLGQSFWDNFAKDFARE